MCRFQSLFLAMPLLLAACATPESAPEPADAGASDRATVRVLSEAAVYRGQRMPEQERLIADLLYEGLQALDEDRLLTPVDDNAHARFQRVLAYDADNRLALEGLERIVLRYVELAEKAAYQGLFDQAELYLQRARFVDADHEGLARAEAALEREKESGDLFFDLEAGAVANQRETAVEQLAEIAHKAREHDAFFLITAPNDAHARWMFSVMRDAVPGFRLRGNIELASRYSVRLRLPEARL